MKLVYNTAIFLQASVVNKVLQFFFFSIKNDVATPQVFY